MESEMKTFLFRGFHGYYTGGVCIASGKSREDAILRIYNTAQKHVNFVLTKKAIRDALKKASPSTGERLFIAFSFPSDPWQVEWNKIAEEEGGKVEHEVYNRLYKTIPKDFHNLRPCFGTWADEGDVEKNPSEFLERVMKELQLCTFENEHCTILSDDFVIIQGGGD